MKKIRLVSLLIAILQVFYLWSISVFAEVSAITRDTVLRDGLYYLELVQNNNGSWGEGEKSTTTNITNIIEYLSSYYSDIEVIESLEAVSSYCYCEDWINVDDISDYLLIDDLWDENDLLYLKNSQNPNGGFGLAKNYASDIIDTKLALKALADLGETEAMTNAAMYIASLQNDDGGFSYQPGLASNPELTAEIADIFGDCIIQDQSLAYTLSETLTDLDEYLDDNMPAIEDLETNDMPEVYQHFHTALFKLKTTESYNVTPYYDLQATDGGGFLFNTVIKDDTISGYYVLITNNGLKLYSLNALNLIYFP